jgi:hypothetical protein
MKGTRRFQHAFGRSAQTKILDAVWDHRDEGINIRQLSQRTRSSYFYTLTALKGLVDRNLIIKSSKGNQSILRPNMAHPVTKAVSRMPH